MRKLFLVTALGFGIAAVSAPTVAWAQVADEAGPLQGSVRAEAEALWTLVDAIKAEVRAGKLEITDDAKLAWQRGVTGWDELRKHGDAGELVLVYKSMKYARDTSRRGAEEAFSGRPTKRIHRALKDYIDAVAPRIEALRERVAEREDVVLDTRYLRIRDAYEKAKELAAVENPYMAWGTLVGALDAADKMILEVVLGQDDDTAE